MRVVLITGAAGGLGQALVDAFLEAGWRVAAACHRTGPHRAADLLLPLVCDVTDRTAIAGAVAQIENRWRRIDALVNNAGLVRDAPVLNLPTADWQSVLATNLRGPFLCCQAVLPLMIRQQAGHILTVSSFAGRSGQRGQANYAAAKAGLLGFTAALAKELGASNICVNSILPGVLRTAMTAGLSSERLAELAAANTLGRLNTAAEVARFSAFLAGLHNVSGQVFQLDSRIVPWT